MAAATASTSFHIRRSFQYNGNLQNSSPKRVKAFQSPTIITASLEARRPQNVSGEFFVGNVYLTFLLHSIDGSNSLSQLQLYLHSSHPNIPIPIPIFALYNNNSDGT